MLVAEEALEIRCRSEARTVTGQSGLQSSPSLRARAQLRSASRASTSKRRIVELNANILSAGKPSAYSTQILERNALSESFKGARSQSQERQKTKNYNS